MYVCKRLPRIALSADKHHVPSHQEQAPQCAKSQEVPVRSPSHRDAGFVRRMLFFSHVSHAYTSIMYLYIYVYKFHDIYIYILLYTSSRFQSVRSILTSWVSNFHISLLRPTGAVHAALQRVWPEISGQLWEAGGISEFEYQCSTHASSTHRWTSLDISGFADSSLIPIHITQFII